MEAISCSASRMGALRSASFSASRTCSATLAITSATCKAISCVMHVAASSCSQHPATSQCLHSCVSQLEYVCAETVQCKTLGSSHRVHCSLRTSAWHVPLL